MTAVYYLQFNQHNVYTHLGTKLLLLGLEDIVEDNEAYSSIRCFGHISSA